MTLKKIPKNDTQKLLEEIIIDLIIQNPSITKDEITKRINKSKATVTRAIKVSKRISYVGSSKGGHWKAQ